MTNQIDWVPVEDALPIDGQEILVTVRISSGYGRVDRASYYESVGFCTEIIRSHDGVVAWAVLPEPYRP